METHGFRSMFPSRHEKRSDKWMEKWKSNKILTFHVFLQNGKIIWKIKGKHWFQYIQRLSCQILFISNSIRPNISVCHYGRMAEGSLYVCNISSALYIIIQTMSIMSVCRLWVQALSSRERRVRAGRAGRAPSAPSPKPNPNPSPSPNHGTMTLNANPNRGITLALTLF